MAFKIPDMPFKIGDIVEGAYIDGQKRYVVIDVRYPWIKARRINGSGGSSDDVLFPARYMRRKVA